MRIVLDLDPREALAIVAALEGDTRQLAAFTLEERDEIARRVKTHVRAAYGPYMPTAAQLQAIQVLSTIGRRIGEAVARDMRRWSVALEAARRRQGT